jgi:predicted PurR-regulated permease PerM
MTSESIKRGTLYLVTVGLGAVLVWQLYYFIPGFLLAVTMYILLRNIYFRLILQYRWKRSLSAIALMVGTLIALALPIWLLIEILIPKITYLVNNSEYLLQRITVIVDELKEKFPQIKISDTQVQQSIQKGLTYVPGILGTTAGIFTNLLTAYFILYFMLISGPEMERRLKNFLPLKEVNKDSIWLETHTLIVSNAIGIPVLAFLQSLIAILGYWIFGVDEFLIWGLLTGICSLLPVIGTMIIWVPIVIYMIATGDVGKGIGLALYCAIIVSNIDNVLRFTVMKKIGDVHPLITVFGVIIGLQMFGIMGLIFGPLLLSYFILLIKVYRAEFHEESMIIHRP